MEYKKPVGFGLGYQQRIRQRERALSTMKRGQDTMPIQKDGM